jgi:hypothetical protein
MKPSYEESIDVSIDEESIEPHRAPKFPRTRDAFAYGRNGPWPQPSADHPLGMAAEVSRPISQEQKDWHRQAERSENRARMRSNLRSAYNAVTRGRARHMSDALFTEQLTTTAYCRYLREIAPERLDIRFHEALGRVSGDTRYYCCDFTPMQDVVPYAKVWVAPTVTLFARDNASDSMRPIAIRIGHLEGKGPDRGWEYIVLTPDDTEAWALAKYFVVQGAAHMTALSGHASIHFPLDIVNAVTKSALPTDHTLFKLLVPHSRMALAMNYAVLETGGTNVSALGGESYAPYCASTRSLGVLGAAGYLGHPHRSSIYDNAATPGRAHPAWRYPLTPTELDAPSHYGHVLRAYHHAIRGFVREVVGEMQASSDTDKGQEELDYIRRWAHHIAHWLPGFPDAHDIMEPDEDGDPYLVAVVTSYIFQASVVHSLEHKSLYQRDPRQTPLRVRVPPPHSRMMKRVRGRRIMNGRDVFRATRAFDMFYRPAKSALLLKDVDYGFEGGYLRGVAIAFRGALNDAEQRLELEGIDLRKYISLGEITASIEY